MSTKPTYEPFEDEIEHALQAERSHAELAPDELQRAWSAMELRLAGAADALDGAGTAATKGAFRFGRWAMFLSGTVLFAAGLGAGVALERYVLDGKDAAPLVQQSDGPRVQEVTEPRRPQKTVAEDAAPPSERPLSRAKRPAPPVSEKRRGSLAQESQLLDVARAALTAGHPEQALEAIGRHQRRYPAGRLAEERQSLRIRALVAAERHAEARAAGERFLRENQSSVFAPQTEALLRSIGEGE